MASIREDFVAFINKGNLVQLAIAFVIGAAFAALITALVADIFTPLIGAAGHFNFSSWQYDLNNSIILQGAWRYIDVDYRPSSGFVYDITTSGVLIGATFNIK